MSLTDADKSALTNIAQERKRREASRKGSGEQAEAHAGSFEWCQRQGS